MVFHDKSRPVPFRRKARAPPPKTLAEDPGGFQLPWFPQSGPLLQTIPPFSPLPQVLGKTSSPLSLSVLKGACMVWPGIKEGVGGAAERLHGCGNILCIPCRALWAVYKTFVLYVLPFLVLVAFVQKAWEVYLVVSEIVDLYTNFTKPGPDL